MLPKAARRPRARRPAHAQAACIEGLARHGV